MTAIHNSQSIRNVYLGPEIDIRTEFRFNHKLYSDNLAPAYVPDPLMYRGDSYRSQPVDQLMLRPAVTIDLLNSLKEDIKNHFEGKIANFWMYALLVYKTGLLFRFCNAADDQIGGPGCSSSLPASEERVPKGFQAAHIATLPTLQLHIADQTHKAVAFGRGSFFHRLANATIWLPVVVNDIDKAFEQRTKTTEFPHSFRYFMTYLLNLLSTNAINPYYGLWYFLSKSLEHLNQVKLSRNAEMRQIVISCYREVAESYLKKIQESDYIVRALCGMIRDRSPIEEIYMKVQAEMHVKLAWEMYALRPVVISDPLLEKQLTTHLNPKRFHPFIVNFIQVQAEKNVLKMTETVRKFVNFSLQVKNVRMVALKYLVNTPDVSLLELDLTKALKIKSQATITKVQLPSTLFDVYSKIIEALVPNVSKNPRNMNAILIRVLSEMCAEPTI